MSTELGNDRDSRHVWVHRIRYIAQTCVYEHERTRVYEHERNWVKITPC